MDIRHWGKRTVSLVLALELMLSPVAMARVADPAQLFAVPETPLGEEVRAQEPSAPAADGDQIQSESSADQTQPKARVLEGDPLPYNQVRITTNLSVLFEERPEATDFDWDTGEIITIPAAAFFRLGGADTLLNVETTTNEGALTGSFWFNNNQPAKWVGYKEYSEGSRYIYLPALNPAVVEEDEYGQDIYLWGQGEYRVPDMEFDGYGMVTVNANGRVEEYIRPLGEGDMETFDPDPTGINWIDPDPIAYTGGRLVELQHAYETVVGDAVNEFNENYLPIAGWFAPSGTALLTALDITAHGTAVETTELSSVYIEDPLELDTLATAASVDLTDFTPENEEDTSIGNKAGTPFETNETNEMWLQVGSDQTSLDLHFQTYEPYYSYTRDGGPGKDVTCPISVTYSFDGGKNWPMDLTQASALECQFLPRPELFNGFNRGSNSPEDKARGDWQVSGIPLASPENKSPKTVDIVLTVTAPNGVDKTTYTIHVQRRQSVEGTGALAYGNTPYGMIERDDGDKWNEEITKEKAKSQFLANGLRFYDTATRPTGAVNQNGGIYHTWPYNNCWPAWTGNVDLDSLAVVAYQDMMFQDPGVVFTDSFGRDVDLDDPFYQGSVTRTIELKRPASNVLSADSWTAGDTSCWYTDTGLSSTQASQTLTSLNQEVDLRGLKVLPGIYKIVYTYTDPCTDATAAGGGGPTYTETLERTLVILPIPGDVDMDGAVTSADAYALRNNLEEWQGSTDERLKLAIGRVFDLNGNGTLEAADYQAILNGYQPELLRTGPVSDYFYLPLPAGNTGYQRRTWDQVKATQEEVTDIGTLTLEFLGVEQGVRNGEYTVAPQGPFATKGKDVPVALPLYENNELKEDNSVFWMGVKLDGSSLNGRRIEDFTISLAYDNRYVEPAQVYTSADKTDYENQAGSGSFEGWSYTLRKYNLRGDTADSQVIWKGTIGAYDEAGSAAARTYQTHYSKVVGELERERTISPLRELVVSLRYSSTTGAAHATVGDGYLLVVPFKLKSHPPKEVLSGSDARLIELSAGMRDLTLVTTPAPTNNFMAFLFSLGRSVEGERTAAFSAQDDIYGGSTQNLRSSLTYDTEEGEVPIGQDNTTRRELPAATYGVSYDRLSPTNIGTGSAITSAEAEALPPGLSYNAGLTRLMGTPLLPGTYDFEINNLRYRLVVNSKTIQYRPRNADSFYGELEYRGTVDSRTNAAENGQRNFEFEYNAKDLADADRTYANSLDGITLKENPEEDDWRDGAELERILDGRSITDKNTKKTYNYTYSAPGFIAQTDARGIPVDQRTGVGDYTIKTDLDATSTCYALEEADTATLTVVARPVYVDHITATAADSGLSIYNDERVSFTGRVLYDKDGSTEIFLTLPLLEGQTTYSGRPLTGDAKLEGDYVAVTYSGQFLYDPSKGDTNTSFSLRGQQELRQVEAETVELREQVTVDGKSLSIQSKNYDLVSTTVQHSKGNDNIQGTVILRGVAMLEMTALPGEFGRTNYYGVQIQNPDTLMMRAVLGEGNSSLPVGQYQYNSPDLFPLVIHYNWVTEEEYQAGIANATEIKEDVKGDRPVYVGDLTGTGVELETNQETGEVNITDTRPYGYDREWDAKHPEDPDPDHVKGGYRNNYLYPDMNGWRVCACVTMYVGDQEGGEGVKYIKCYSDAITVRPSALTLTVRPATRYYGEELGQDQLSFTFRTSQLATKDTPGVTRGTSEELKMVFDRLDAELAEQGVAGTHQMPRFKMVDEDGNEVTATTSIVPGMTYQIVLEGAKSPCYDIQYTVQKEGEGSTVSSTAGAAPLTIQPRPIIVQSIRGNGENGTFTNIYADTRNLVVTNDWQDPRQSLEASGANVDFVLPRYDTARGTTSYYTATSDGNMYTDYGCTFHEPTDENPEFTVVAGDDVRVRYQVRFLPDEGHYTWTEFTQGFFDNDAIAASETGYLNKFVQVERLELTGADAGNYLLVYADNVSFIDRVPADAVYDENTKSAPANNDQAVNKLYYVSGEGRVYLRPIQNIVITKLGQMTYTYGDQFAPDQPGTAGEAMTLRVEYATLYDNDPSNNFTSEDVVYGQLRVDEEGNRISTFAARGFTVYYVKPGQSQTEAETLNQTLVSGNVMVPGIHHGAHLFVTGRRSAKDALVYSQYAPQQAEEPIVVTKATLTLTAADAHKFYGEENPAEDYTFTFDTRDLVQMDQDKLRALNGGTLNREGTEADLEKLEGKAITGLLFSTDANSRSPVGENGRWGEYDLRLTAANNGETVLSNYNVITRGAHLYIYPRPVRVTGINSSPEDPVYTIFNDPTTFTYTTGFSTAQREGLQPRVVVECGSPLTGSYPAIGPDGVTRDLPITGSLGMLSGDDLIFTARVEFPSGWDLSGGADLTMGVRVTIQELVTTATARNYNLLVGQGESFGDLGITTGDNVVWGSAKLRTIRSIAITNPPRKLDYTYGETLDLTGLQVRVGYAQLDQETGVVEEVVVDYYTAEQFESMGLYVNYWTPGDELPVDNNLRRALPKTYWRADIGDHLTIAPTHETQAYLTAPGATPKEKPFSANGKHLVISGFQVEVAGEHNRQEAATPVILGAHSDVTDNYEDMPYTTIKVNPRKLRFTLSAEDKTYDGDTRAAGALTLTNVYGTTATADVVYIPMGADYEKNSMNHSDFNSFKQHVVNGQVTFSTGTYVPNGEAPVLANGRTNWAPGYTWGQGLTFTFPNPNVHYVDDSGVSGVGSQTQATYWRASQTFGDVTDGWDSYREVTFMPVEVTNMVLAGPDAANYTWAWDSDWTWDVDNSHQVTETEVLMTTRSAAQDGQAAVPFATIRKANRTPIQALNGFAGKYAQLMVDRATNVVRLLFAQSLSALEDNNNLPGTADEFRDELHFEYALLYAKADEDGNPTGLLAQWAGVDGQKEYQDTTFFGGEAVRPKPTAEGYQPNVDRLPKEEKANEKTIYKGQIYGWAEEDTGYVMLGGNLIREDSGFVFDTSAFPGGPILTDKNGNVVKAEDAYWYYTLYTTDRAALPRNTVFYPLVRLAETHNYNPSGNLSGNAQVTAELLDAAQKALAALEDEDTAENMAAAKEASQAVLDAARGMTDEARSVAQAQVDADAAQGANTRWPDVQPSLQMGPASAVKTLTQRLDLISASTERSQISGDSTKYLVEMLEAVWFTDTLIYQEEKFFSAAVYNHPTRYYGYFWDTDMTAKLEFREKALNFTEEILVPVRVKLEDGSRLDTTLTVNTVDETVGGRVAKIYVQIVDNSGHKVHLIQIMPTVLYARLGDEPYQLSWLTDPERPSNLWFTWTTSDPSVATVDENGLVTFRGVGTCTITLATDNGKFSTITVTVSEYLPLVQVAQSCFDLYHNQAWMELDEDGNFYPTLPMTRAQVVELLDLFLDPNGQWAATTELAYVDVTGEEKYADALRRMTGAGVVTGLPGSAFGGDNLITRAEFAAMVARILRLEVPDTKGRVHQFIDSGEDDTWAYAYIDALAMTGVTKGTGGGTFDPNRILTREEAAAVISRLLTVKLDLSRPDLKTPADMTPDNWSYEYVLHAVNTIVFPRPVPELDPDNH